MLFSPAASGARATRCARLVVAVRASASSARASTSTPRSSTTVKGVTLAAASSLDKDVKGSLKTGADKGAAAEVGKLIAARAVAAGVKEVIFDRGGYTYHGRVAALANAAREGGLSF